MKKMLIVVLAMAMTLAGAAVVMAKISGTPHDLRTGTAQEMCAFCHTPHAGTSADGPLWNRSQSGQTYTPYTSSSFDMQPGSGTGYGTSACLICHNGVLSTLVNYPGAGLTSTADAGYNFNMSSDITGSDWRNVAIVGTDLRDDHPVGFTYCAGNVLDQDNNGFPTFTNNTANLNSTIYKLYNGKMECATCHSVHHTASYATATSWSVSGRTYTSAPTAGSEVYFLRTSNKNSKMCLDCHTLR